MKYGTNMAIDKAVQVCVAGRSASGGVRQIEIDVYADTKGERYSHPAILGMVAK